MVQNDYCLLTTTPGWIFPDNFLQNKVHVQTNTKSVQCLCINTKHNKVCPTQSQWTSRKHVYWRSLQGLSGKWKWGRQMARPWKPPAWCKILGHNSYTSHIILHFVL